MTPYRASRCIHGVRVRTQIDRSDPLTLDVDPSKQRESATSEVGSVRTQWRKLGPVVGAPTVRGEQLTIGRVHAGVNDVRLGSQRCERGLCAVSVVEQKGRGSVVTDHFCQDGQVALQVTAKVDDLVAEEAHAGQRQRSGAGQHDDPGQLLVDRAVPRGSAL